MHAIEYLEFDEVLNQYERMIYHLIHKLCIDDQYGDFYQVGLIALLETYRKYKDRNTFHTLAYITIKSRLIDEIRKSSRIMKEEVLLSESIEVHSLTTPNFKVLDSTFWLTIKRLNRKTMDLRSETNHRRKTT